MKQWIELKNITFHAHHGVFEQERIVGNTFTIDLKLGVDIYQAMLSDNLVDTLNYAQIYDVIKHEMSIPSKLLERVAGRIIFALKETFPTIRSVELKLAKVNPPFVAELDHVAIIVEHSF
ncbi:MAG: dihydroneopterin aldolase [Tannerellaceae bacterium]